MSDGFDDVTEILHSRDRSQVKGYCFYHGQDLERAVEASGLMLAFGDLDDIRQKKIEIGEIIIRTLERNVFASAWDGRSETRINIPGITWQHRSPDRYLPFK